MKQRILVSVDTEAPIGSNAVDNMIYCKTKDGEYGIKYLFDLFEEFGIKALFFVDIPEIVDHGSYSIQKVMEDIENAGHDIGVHVHPDHMLDSNRRYLWEYTRDEQFEIISRCTDFYEMILGRKPKSFRAGRYGANNDTLDILAQLGYKYDMSLFYSSKYCKIAPYFTCNRVKEYKESGLLEFPVTTFKSFTSPFYSRNDQIAPGFYPFEFKKDLKEIIKSQEIDVISLIFHSFEFIDWRKNPDKPSFNERKLFRVRKNLEFIKQNGTKYISENELQEILWNYSEDLGKLDLSKGAFPVFFFARRAIRVIHDKYILNV